MIIDIPDKEDFFQSGLSMLNLAWNAVASLYIDLEYSELDDQGEEGQTTEAYWKAAQHPISIALALAQQGIELFLKGRIAEVSDEGDVDQNHQNIYLFLLSQEVGFDGGRLRYLGVGASAISTAILKEEREEKI